MTELELKELELKVVKLEKEKAESDVLIRLLARAVDSFCVFQDQFKNGDGIVPRIIDGLTNNFEKSFENHKKQTMELFNNHEQKISAIVEVIPCTKLLGDGCNFKLISNDDPLPPGYKEITRG